MAVSNEELAMCLPLGHIEKFCGSALVQALQENRGAIRAVAAEYLRGHCRVSDPTHLQAWIDVLSDKALGRNERAARISLAFPRLEPEELSKLVSE